MKKVKHVWKTKHLGVSICECGCEKRTTGGQGKYQTVYSIGDKNFSRSPECTRVVKSIPKKKTRSMILDSVQLNLF